MKTGVELIAAERRRQIDKEGYDAEHDKDHDMGELATAGACYAMEASVQIQIEQTRLRIPVDDAVTKQAPAQWPWAQKWWKPTAGDPVRQFVKAGALIAAAIDRLQMRQPNTEHAG